MESNGSGNNSQQSQPSDTSSTANEENPTEKDVFVNHGMSLLWKL